MFILARSALVNNKSCSSKDYVTSCKIFCSYMICHLLYAVKCVISELFRKMQLSLSVHLGGGGGARGGGGEEEQDLEEQ